MLKLEHLSLRRGARELLHDVSLIIHDGQRVGITGANGIGKSSLFALIMGQLQADSGECYVPTNKVIAHVAQETPALNRTALDYVLDGDQPLRQLQQAIADAEQQQQGEQQALLYAELDAIDGYSANSRAAILLHGLGFSNEDEQRHVSEFSGGWRMRLNLAQALMCRSDILLLDEPTNHLDLDAVIWLENWLKQYKGTLLLISHDRDFLDAVTTHIMHIEQQSAIIYSGNYSRFEIQRAEKLALQQSAYEKQQREIRHMESFVQRFKAKATKAKQAQSRIKALERMQKIAPAHIDSPFDFSFYAANKMPSPLLQLEKAAVGYQQQALLANVNITIHPGDRIGLLGHNGAGKSTLIKLLAAELDVMQGEMLRARDLNIGYFAQHQLEQLDDNASPLLHLQRLDPDASENALRNFLGGFAFHDEMATNPVAPLSGGEKARLVLALIVYQRPNLLLLDEPTNHLDLEMRHALTMALQEYEGAMIVVSHDRHLLRTVTDVLYLVDNGQVTEFRGTLEDYRQLLLQQQRDSKSENTESAAISKKQLRQQSAEKRKQLKPLQNRLKNLEKKLAVLSAEKQQHEQMLSDNELYNDKNRTRLDEVLQQQAQVNQALSEVEAEWLEVSEKLETMQ